MRRFLPSVPIVIAMLCADTEAASQGSCPRIREQDLIEEWKYAPAESSSPERLIGAAGWVSRSRSGKVFVLDLQPSRIIRLDPHGRFEGTFGTSGRGPGEILTASGVRATSAGEVAVLDQGQNRMVFFSEEGEHLRTVRLGITVTNARDFLVLDNGQIVISGTVTGSDAVIHRLSADGGHLESMGSMRMELTEPILRARYSDGAIAPLPGGAIAFAQRTPFRLQVYRGGRRVVDRTDPQVVPDYVHEVAQRVGAGWRFLWRHPRLTSLLPLANGCFLVAVQVPPDDPEAERSDFRTTLFVLDAQGRVASETRLERFLWPTQLWNPGDGARMLGFIMNRETEVLHPVQYRISGR